MGKDKAKQTKKSNKKKEKNRQVEEKPNRDFSIDLNEYLDKWQLNKKSSTNAWKFSKVLQTWALANLFSITKISDEIFDKLIPYIESIQGGARDRVKENSMSKLNEIQSNNNNGDNSETVDNPDPNTTETNDTNSADNMILMDRYQRVIDALS